MSTEWSSVKSKAQRRKRSHTQKLRALEKQREIQRQQQLIKRQKELQKARANGHNAGNGRSQPQTPQRPRLNNQQYRVMQLMLRQPEYFECGEALLSRIILDLNIGRVSQLENKTVKLKVLDLVVSEFQNKMSGKKVTKSPLNSQNNNNRGGNGENRLQHVQQMGQRDRIRSPNTGSKMSKSGKFRHFMSKVGSEFLDCLDIQTMSALLQIPSFSFIPKGVSITPLQRYRVYTLPKNIEYRVKEFNTTLNVDSSLKLYDLRKAESVEVEDCLSVMMANGLSLDHRFRGKEWNGKSKKEYQVVMHLKKGMVPAARVLMDGCKALNVWSSNMDFEDLSSGYLVDFAEYQRGKQAKGPMKKPPVGAGTSPSSTSRRVDEQEGERYLNALSRLVVNATLAGKENMKSVHCCYLKVLREREYEVHSWLWVFVELKDNNYPQEMPRKKGKGKKRKETKGRQFMVWKGQCGCTKL